MTKIIDLARVMEQVPDVAYKGPVSSWKRAGERRRAFFVTKAANVLAQLRTAGYEVVKTRHNSPSDIKEI